jgi:hypothetical protein
MTVRNEDYPRSAELSPHLSLESATTIPVEA